jgi:outer membrane protein assembly factor BamA
VKEISRQETMLCMERFGRLFWLGALLSCLICTGWSQTASINNASPQIFVDKVVVTDDATGLADSIRETLKPREGQAYSAEQDSAVRSEVQSQLAAHGYLEATVAVTHGAPRQDGDRQTVDLQVTVTPGRQYRISSISAGGGPLLPSRDLSPSFSSKPGDVAGEGAFGRVPADLRAYYWRYGYADVETPVSAKLDREHATVAYRLDVAPGPLYHVRSLSIEKLNADQENKVRTFLGLKPGDVFDQTAVTALYRKIPTDPMLAGYGFTFTPKEDKTAAVVDVVLDFYKKGPGASITFR